MPAGRATSYFLIIISLHPDVISRNLTSEKLVKPPSILFLENSRKSPHLVIFVLLFICHGKVSALPISGTTIVNLLLQCACNAGLPTRINM